MDDDVVAKALAFIDDHSVAELIVNDLTSYDLDGLGWSGSATHLMNVASQLDRVATDEVDYLAVRLPSGETLAKGGVDFAEHPGAGTIWQLATREGLEGLGIATRLIRALESRVVARALPVVRLAVEPGNDRARRLYEHLGYVECGYSTASWEAENDDGEIYLHSTPLVEMVKQLHRDGQVAPNDTGPAAEL